MRNTHEDFLKKFHERYDATEYTVLSTYTKNTEKIDIRHNVCGSIKSVMPKSAMDSKKHGATCLVCSPVKKTGIRYGDMTETDFINHVSNNYKDYKFKLLTTYSHKQNDSIEVEHNCGHIFLSRPEYWLRNEGKCNVCANKVRKEHIQKMQMKNNYLENLTRDTDYMFVEEYKKDNKLKHTLLHKTCNRTYDVRPNDFQQGYRFHQISTSPVGNLQIVHRYTLLDILCPMLKEFAYLNMPVFLYQNKLSLIFFS